MGERMELLQGTLDLLILKTLALEPMHGWAISQRLRQISDGVLSVQQGSLYPALQRLELQGWIVSEWRSTEGNRRARFYSLSRSGRRRLEKRRQIGSASPQPSSRSCGQPEERRYGALA